MSKRPADSSAARDALRAFAPKLVDLTDNVLFGDVWERPGLSKRDRSLITCAALVALNRTEQQVGHFQRAINKASRRRSCSSSSPISPSTADGPWPCRRPMLPRRCSRENRSEDLLFQRLAARHHQGR